MRSVYSVAGTWQRVHRASLLAKISCPRASAGVGGWTFAPWRGVFYPPGLPHAKELGYAAAHLTSIEINGTFYRTQTPATFRKWANEVPDGFRFSVKGPRYTTHRRELKDAQPRVAPARGGGCYLQGVWRNTTIAGPHHELAHVVIISTVASTADSTLPSGGNSRDRPTTMPRTFGLANAFDHAANCAP